MTCGPHAGAEYGTTLETIAARARWARANRAVGDAKGGAAHGAFLYRLLLAGRCHTFGHPRRRFRLHPIQSFETGLKFVDWLNRSIGPFGLYFPILTIFKNHTKYRSSRRHVFTYPHMMARRE